MTRLRTSVALATYNGERFLPGQLASLASQTVRPDELVVADDGSTDRTLAIVADFARAAPFPVRLLRNATRLGHKANFMHLSGACRGDWIFFCDQDDVWSDTKIATVLDHADDPSVLLLFHDSAIVTESLQLVQRFWPDAGHARREARPDVTPWGFCPGYSQAVHKDLLVFNDLWPQSVQPGSDGPLAHDAWFFFLGCALHATRYIDEPLVQYRQHTANAVGFQTAATLADRLLGHTGTPRTWDLSASRAALARAELSQAILDRRPVPPDTANRLRDTARRYRALADRLLRRHRMMAAPSLGARLSLMGRNIASGDYGLSTAWRFSMPGMVRDLGLAAFTSTSGR